MIKMLWRREVQYQYLATKGDGPADSVEIHRSIPLCLKSVTIQDVLPQLHWHHHLHSICEGCFCKSTYMATARETLLQELNESGPTFIFGLNEANDCHKGEQRTLVVRADTQLDPCYNL